MIRAVACCLPWAMLVTTCGSVEVARCAGPSNTDSYGFLPVVMDEGLASAGGVWERVTKSKVKPLGQLRVNDNQIRAQLGPMIALWNEGDLRKIGVQRVENTHQLIAQLERDSHDLGFWGEATSVDIENRTDAYRRSLVEIARAMAGDPGLKRTIDARKAAAIKLVNKHQKSFSTVDRQLDRNDFKRAEELLAEMRLDVEGPAVWWLTDNTYRDRMEPLQEKREEFYLQWRDAWIAAAVKATGAAAERLSPNLEAFEKMIGDAATTLATEPQAQLGSRQVTGPEAVGLIGVAWVRYQRDLLQRRGLARLLEVQGGSLKRSDVEQQTKQLNQIALDGMEAILTADAKRCTPEEAEQNYIAYLQQLARIAPLTDEQALRERMQPGLQQLLKRSPALQGRVNAYQTATGEMLRWRQRVAEQQQQAVEQAYPPLADVVTDATGRVAGGPGFVSDQATNSARAGMLGPLPASVSIASQNLIDREARIADVVGLGGNAKLGISPYGNRTICYTQTTAADVADQVALLKADLFADAGVPAVTWDAAVALVTAEQGDFTSVGGKITRLGVIGWSAFHTSRTDQQRGQIRLTPLPGEDLHKLNDVVIRLILDPTWVRHRYFFQQLAE